MAFMHHLKKKIVSDKGMTACRGPRMQAACTGYTYPGGEPTCGCQVHKAGIIAASGHQRERMHAALPICMRWRAGRWLWCWIGRVLGGRLRMCTLDVCKDPVQSMEQQLHMHDEAHIAGGCRSTSDLGSKLQC